MARKPAVLLILDGYGLAPAAKDNAIAAANTPTLNSLREHCSTVLDASGTAVGLPEGQMGSSEVNHLNMGAGRVVPQDITRINEAIRNNELANNSALKKAFDTTGTVHFLGLVSDGGVHSTLNHLLALLKEAKQHNKYAVISFGMGSPISSSMVGATSGTIPCGLSAYVCSSTIMNGTGFNVWLV